MPWYELNASSPSVLKPHDENSFRMSLALAIDLFWTPMDAKGLCAGNGLNTQSRKEKKLKSRLSLARQLYNSQCLCCIHVNKAATPLDIK